MLVLGISCHYHDSAAALTKDGQVVAAAGEERFTRRKYDDRFPSEAAAWCMEDGGVEAADLDAVAFYEKPVLKFERLVDNYLAQAPRGLLSFVDVLPRWLGDRLWIKSRLRKNLEYKGPVLFCEHHLSHAAHSFLSSGFEEAGVLTVDGVGEWATATFGSASRAGGVRLSGELRWPHSVGLFYSAVTQFLGFGVNEGEYKVMGLAPYGRPAYGDALERAVDVAGDGSVRLDMRYFEFARGRSMTGGAMADLLGMEPRAPGAPLEQAHKDLAASAQSLLEKVVLRMGRHVHEQTGMSRLCMGGGVALNGAANGRLLREGPFERVYVPPAPGDAGSAAGCAQWAHGMLSPGAPTEACTSPYLGPSFSDEQILSRLEALGAECRRPAGGLAAEAARVIAGGGVLGWFQGRAEWGPRALGNRSILADPRRAEMKDVINEKIKRREGFRPFAPSVLRERASEYFELDCESPHMSLVVGVKQPDKIPAVTHVDGTARVQTVSAEQNRPFYDLISEFFRITGVPVVLNTSMNVAGEPMANSPEDAHAVLAGTGMDALAAGSYMVTGAPASDG